MKFKELKSKSEKELQRLLSETRHNLQELEFKVHANQLKNLREVRVAKKTIARVLMLLGDVKDKPKEETK